MALRQFSVLTFSPFPNFNICSVMSRVKALTASLGLAYTAALDVSRKLLLPYNKVGQVHFWSYS
jgi:hypothetical protein